MQRLKQRGIFDVAVKSGWRVSAYDGAPGWIYPLFHFDGQRSEVPIRWKAADSDHHPKYAWPVKDAPREPFYMLPGTLDAIKHADGVVHIVAGEPDNLTMHAAGIHNVLSWFGETAVPHNLVELLKFFGVRRAIYYYDLDKGGLAGARRTAKTLEGSGIELSFRKPDGEMDSKRDLNAVWQDVKFSRADFLIALSKMDTVLPELPQQQRQSIYVDDSAEVQQAVCAEIAQRLKPRGKEHYYECPYPDHSEPKDFIFEPASGRVGGCQGKHSGNLTRWRDLAEFLGIDVSGIARDIAAKNRPQQQPDAKKPKAQNGRKGIPIISSVTALSTYSSWVNKTALPDIEPILAPFLPFQKLGGLARLWVPRKVILTIGPSGMGKTSLAETTQDILCLRGLDSMMWGREWSPVEYQMRRVAAWGGPSFERQWEDFLYSIQEQRGIPAAQREGKPLSADERALVNRIIQKIQKWPGQVHFIDGSGRVSMLLEAAERKIYDLRKAGRRIVVLYWDYIQKSLMHGENWAELEIVLGEIAQFCIDQDMIGYVNSQVNKGTSQDVMEGEMLNEGSAQMISDQKLNVVFTLNPVYVDKQRIEEAWLGCVKNSAAPAPSSIKVKTALYRHRWTETVLSEVVRSNATDRQTLPDDESMSPLYLEHLT